MVLYMNKIGVFGFDCLKRCDFLSGSEDLKKIVGIAAVCLASVAVCYCFVSKYIFTSPEKVDSSETKSRVDLLSLKKEFWGAVEKNREAPWEAGAVIRAADTYLKGALAIGSEQLDALNKGSKITKAQKKQIFAPLELYAHFEKGFIYSRVAGMRIFPGEDWRKKAKEYKQERFDRLIISEANIEAQERKCSELRKALRTTPESHKALFNQEGTIQHAWKQQVEDYRLRVQKHFS